MRLFDIAKSWVDRGFSVIPMKYYSKQPPIKWDRYKFESAATEQLRYWFRSDLSNIALVTGYNNLVVIDFDVYDVFEYWYATYPINTYMVKSRRGVHVYLQINQLPENHHNPLLDIKSKFGYVLIPPSIHPSGAQYGRMTDFPIMRIDKLSDVLPDEYLPEPIKVVNDIQKTEYDYRNHEIADPWAIADQAAEVPANAVEVIRGRHPLLSYFPRAERTSADGRWWVCQCPFHDDKNPSFWIDTVKRICGCRVCNIAAMDVINLHARLNKISNRQAILELIKK